MVDSPEDAKASSPPRAVAGLEGAGESGRHASPLPEPPALDELDENSDYSAFLHPELSEELHRRALRMLFHAPRFNRRDGLDDYDEDYRRFALLDADTVTADMRHQMERRQGPLTPDVGPPRAVEDPDTGASAAKVGTRDTVAALESDPRTRSAGLPVATTDGARTEGVALDSFAAVRQSSTSAVEYRSAGRLLIIGGSETAGSVVGRLGGRVTVAAITERLAGLSGHLGAFRAVVDIDGRLVNAAVGAGLERDGFDLVLDLNEVPALSHEVLPPGYFAPGADPAALDRALAEIPQLVGDFEKPRFFDYEAATCAHGRRGLTACERCIAACSTHAIRPLGDAVEVDPYLCQGCGSCTLVCPSGAIRYAHPRPAGLLDHLRQALQGYRQAGRRAPRLVFHDGGAGAEYVGRVADGLPEDVLPVEVEAVGSIGMEVWLSGLAYGAGDVVLLAGPDTAPSVLREIESQLGFARAILEGMGYAGQSLRLIEAGGERTPAEVLSAVPHESVIEPATFAGFNDKRLGVRLAVEHLYVHAPDPVPAAPLPAGAPFGGVRVDRQACTLCMACVAVCPSAALQDGGDRPALRFTEADCVQCGLCEAACPEDAVSLVPRMAYERALYTEARVLNEEPPFRCVSCGRPYATRKIIERMTEKLTGHWMFQDPAARRRLEMCEDCKVSDMFEAGQASS